MIFSLVDAKTFFFIVAGGAFVSFVLTFLLLDEPKGAFSQDFDDDEAAQSATSAQTATAAD